MAGGAAIGNHHPARLQSLSGFYARVASGDANGAVRIFSVVVARERESAEADRRRLHFCQRRFGEALRHHWRLWKKNATSVAQGRQSWWRHYHGWRFDADILSIAQQ